ncbi:hypothetical protein H6P81_000980 [Aristolochia fimbriata]|uniref:Uncharacterized protein n=1 Tax=Aristolochia fimbriata TaxID=158543 RepID=A0AAV7F5R6_ARIFI|nr:hypothetical protein H6P81_000980 [Aristolochia fimbriata]
MQMDLNSLCWLQASSFSAIKIIGTGQGGREASHKAIKLKLCLLFFLILMPEMWYWERHGAGDGTSSIRIPELVDSLLLAKLPQNWSPERLGEKSEKPLGAPQPIIEPPHRVTVTRVEM